MAASKHAPGKAHRKGFSLRAILRRFPDDAQAEAWFIQQRWPHGICCPCCGSLDVQTGCQHKTMPFRCREKACANKFSVRTGSVMESSKIGFQDWLVVMFLVTTNRNSVSSMKLHRDLAITQKSAWFLARRLRQALAGRGAVGKTAVVGAKDRATKQVAAKVVAATDAATLQGFVQDKAASDATVFTDDAAAHETLPFDHDTVKHSLRE